MLDLLKQDLDERVPHLLAEHQVPGVGVGVRVGEEVVATGYGVTNLEHPLHVDEHTIFQVGSISKTFVGVIAAQLDSEGVLLLDDPVAPLLRDLGPIDHRITMRHLLTHSSGIDAQHMIGSAREILADNADDSIQASIKHFADDALMFDPGSDFSYSGPGFMVAGAAIERALNMRWKEALVQRVLKPAKMSHTFTTADEVITHRVAAPHDISAEQAVVARNQGWQLGWQLPGWDVPGGGVLSSASELMKYAHYAWNQAQQYDLFVPIRDRGQPGASIGLGWMVEQRRGHTAVGHNGLTIGYASRFLTVPEKQIAFTTLTNSLKGDSLNTSLERIMWDHLLRSRDPSEKRLAKPPAGLEGVYECGFYGDVELRRKDDSGSFALHPVGEPESSGGFVIEPPSIPHIVHVEPGVLTSDPSSDLAEHTVAYVLNDQARVRALRIGERIARRRDNL